MGWMGGNGMGWEDILQMSVLELCWLGKDGMEWHGTDIEMRNPFYDVIPCVLYRLFYGLGECE